MLRVFFIWGAVCVTCLAGTCWAQELRVPSSVTAGDDATISTSGSGKATFYLVGPGISQKSEINLGEDIPLHRDDLQNAGEYTAILCASECQSASFFVNAGKPSSLTFLVHPSRVPTMRDDAISGLAFAFDAYGNLVLTPGTINFELASGNSSLLSRSVRTEDGAAWFRTGSGKAAGRVQAIASLDNVTARHVVQEVAADPCSLRINGHRTAKGIEVETEPVRDCTGNIVPDGTIVTFTATVGNDRSTVDAPVKEGIARAEIEAPGTALISAASGVVQGNELRVGEQR
jgi:hypothetical protein